MNNLYVMRNYFISFLLLCVISGCISPKPIIIEYSLEPESETPFPYVYDNLLIVNKAKEKSADNSVYLLNDTSYNSYDYEKRPINESFINILAEKIQSSAVMNDVSIYNYNIDSEIKRLTKSQIEMIFSETGNDLILTLDNLDHSSIIYNHSDAKNIINHRLLIKSDFSLYIFPDTVPLWQSSKVDTLNWSGYAFTDFEKNNILPDVNDCIYDACYINAENCVPYWFPVKEKLIRYFMNHSNPALREAYDYYAKDDREACEIMLDYALKNYKSKKIKKISYYNKGVLADEREDYIQAANYIKECIKLDEKDKYIFNISLEEYYNILTRRASLK